MLLLTWTHPSICVLLFLVTVFQILFFKFIYLLLAVLGLRCCAGGGFLSLRGVEATLHCGACASHYSSFSCYGVWALGVWASVVTARGLSSCGSRALERRLSSCGTWA